VGWVGGDRGVGWIGWDGKVGSGFAWRWSKLGSPFVWALQDGWGPGLAWLQAVKSVVNTFVELR
jgi:hypothetical protein